MDSKKTLINQPSGWLPLVMSFVALALVFGHIALFGIARQDDEGAFAHIWQLLMAGQVFIVVFFAIRYLPHKPKQALLVLALQIVAALAAGAPVFFLHW